MTVSDLKFFKDLKKNNRREWFLENKARYETALQNFKGLVQTLIFGLAEFDASLEGVEVQSSLFRIYRDVRFSKDKSPYKTFMGAFLCGEGRKSQRTPGYYIHFEPDGESVFGAGLYHPAPEVLDRLRADVLKPKSKICAFLDNKTFRKKFPNLVTDDAAKTVPRQFDKSHRHAEYLKLRSYCVHRPISDAEMLKSTLMKTLLRDGKELAAFNRTLSTIGAK